jgi:hypothetical protein
MSNSWVNLESYKFMTRYQNELTWLHNCFCVNSGRLIGSNRIESLTMIEWVYNIIVIFPVQQLNDKTLWWTKH